MITGDNQRTPAIAKVGPPQVLAGSCPTADEIKRLRNKDLRCHGGGRHQRRRP